MRIGLSTAAFYGLMETEDAAAQVARLGLPCCEVFLETYSEYTASFGALVKERLGEHTQAVSIHNKTQHFETDFTGQSVRQREDALSLYEGFLQAGHALGASIHVFHGPGSVRVQAPDFSRWQEKIGRAVDLAASYGIDFCWETVSWCYLISPERVTLFRSLWPKMHFVLDLKQVFEMRQDPLDYVKAMGDKLRHIHILDYDADGKLVLPGCGCHDFKAFARAIKDIGYRGDIILEPYASTVPNEAALRESIAWLNDTFKAV